MTKLKHLFAPPIKKERQLYLLYIMVNAKICTETETIIAKASSPKTTNKFLIIIGPRQQQTF